MNRVCAGAQRVLRVLACSKALPAAAVRRVDEGHPVPFSHNVVERFHKGLIVDSHKAIVAFGGIKVVVVVPDRQRVAARLWDGNGVREQAVLASVCFVKVVAARPSKVPASSVAGVGGPFRPASGRSN